MSAAAVAGSHARRSAKRAAPQENVPRPTPCKRGLSEGGNVRGQGTAVAGHLGRIRSSASPRRICDHDASRASGIACRAVASPIHKPKGLLGPAHRLHVAVPRRHAVMDRNTRLPLSTGWTTIDSVEGSARSDQATPDRSIGSRDGTDPHSRRSTRYTQGAAPAAQA